MKKTSPIHRSHCSTRLIARVDVAEGPMRALVDGGYNWKAIVAGNKPGSDSDSARRRGAAFSQLVPELQNWAVRHSLPVDRVASSAYTGVASTLLSDFHQLESLLVAQYVFWLFCLDDHLDRACLANGEAPADDYEAQLAFLSMFLLDLAGVKNSQIDTLGLGRMTGREPKMTSMLVSLRDSLAEIYGTTKRAVPAGAVASSGEYVAQNFAIQLARMNETWRQELDDSAARRAGLTSSIPDMEYYLRRGSVSIGLPPIATVPMCFELDPQGSWERCAAHILSAGYICRLCNDLGNWQREVAERKINAVVIALAESGLDPFGVDEIQGREVERAIGIVVERLGRELACFSKLCAELADGHLPYWLRSMPAFAIAMYEKGNYLVPQS
jgi:hypothetical protein